VANFVIIGATGGIGSHLSRKLASAGHRLMLAARDAAKLERLAGVLSAHSHAVEATDFAAVENLFDAARAELGQIEGAVNLAGSILLKPAHLTKPEEYDETIAQNLTSAFAVVRSAAKAMTKSGGSIVLVSTAAARVGLTNHEAVAAAKAGVEGLARSAAATYAKHGIRVNVVAPGLVDTPLASRITSNEAALEASKAMHPLGRIGEPEEVAAAIAWMLDPAQSWVTGQVLGVDGGLSTVRPR
jgi:NAD(P)-dependent dehydrogenase (short-subunit alcohol dehydrogenase family)